METAPIGRLSGISGAAPGGQAVSVMAFTVVAGRIVAIDALTDRTVAPRPHACLRTWGPSRPARIRHLPDALTGVLRRS
jgi:hypothetical protein